MLSEFVQIRERLENVSASASEIIGEIIPTLNEISLLKALSANNCLEDLVFTGSKHISIKQIIVGQKIQIKLYPLNLISEKYYETCNELLKGSSQNFPKNKFYVFELNFDSTSNEKPIEIKKYEAITQLITFLISISDYQKDKELVFFKTQKLSITTEYLLNDLKSDDNISSLISHINESADKEERTIIFINELIASLNKISEIKLRFKYLLNNFDELYLNYKKSHSLYLEKYSYQKFKSELDKEIIEYSKNIQAVINDAQSKLVAIPVAFLLIVGQFDLTGDKIHLNIALILSSIVFSVLLEVLIRNQFSALDFISDDVTRFQNSVDEKKVEILGQEFTATFSKIKGLYDKQKCYLNIIRLLVWLTPFFAICMFILSLLNNSLINALNNL